MATGTVTGIHLLTDWTCNSGVVKGVVPATQWTLAERIEQDVVWKTTTVVVPMAWSQSAELQVGRVLKFWDNDNGTEDFVEYRITDMTIDARLGMATLTGVYWLQDLLEKNLLVTQSGQMNVVFDTWAVAPSTSISVTLLDALPSYWDAGTCTPSDTVDLHFAHSTALAAAIQLSAAVKVKSGVAYEWSARRNGIVGLYLDLTVYGGSTVVDVRTAKNLANVRQTVRRGEQSTRVYPSGAGALSRPTFVVSAVSANTYIDVTEVNEFGPGPAREDDQFNTYYWREQKNTTSHLITDTTRVSYGTTRLAMTSTATIAVGDRGFLTDVSGNDLLYIDSPAYQALYGIRVGVMAGEDDPYTNYIRNPAFRNGSATTPTSWTITGTPDKRDASTGLVRQGGSSYYLPSSASVQWSETIQATTDETWTYTVGLFIGTAGTGVVRFTTPGTGTTTDINFSDLVPPPNSYVEASMSFTMTSTGAKNFQVAVISGTGDCYVDNACLTRSDAAVTFREGSSPANNIAIVNAHFDSNGEPIPTYEVSVLDLAAIDRARWPLDSLQVGATIAVTEEVTALERTSLRIVQMERNSRSPATPSFTLSTLPRRLSRDLVTVQSTAGATRTIAVQSGGTSGGSGITGVDVRKNTGAVVGTRPQLNFIEGSNITLTIADDAGDDEIDITIAASGGGSGLTHPQVLARGLGV